MHFELDLSDEANETLDKLEKFDTKKYRKVAKALQKMQVDLRNPSLNTHKYKSYPGLEDKNVFESYVENNTPSAWRIFWYYGPTDGVLTIIAITPHP